MQPINPTTLLVGHTPVRGSVSSTERFGLLQKLAEKRRKLDDEMTWTFLPMKEWMAACVSSTEPPQDIQLEPFAVQMTSEKSMYPGLCNGFNNILSKIGCESFDAWQTDDNPDTVAKGSKEAGDRNALKPDVVIYPRLQQAKDAYKMKPRIIRDMPSRVGGNVPHASSSDDPAPTETTATLPDHSLSSSQHPSSSADPLPISEGAPQPEPSTVKARVAWSWAEVVVEVKHDEAKFPFLDSELLSTAEKRVDSRGQLVQYASELFRRQHRQSVFLICVCLNKARFLRFDRAGAVVSESFDYVSSNAAFGQFFYALFGPSGAPIQRGHDPTVSLASPDEEKIFRSLHHHDEYQKVPAIADGFKDAATTGWPIYCISITSPWSKPTSEFSETFQARLESLNAVSPKDRDDTHRCLVGRPAFSTSSMIGRGTRCFVAYDLNAGIPVFIKDTWRANVHGVNPELETYHTLWEDHPKLGKPEYILTPLGGGDVALGDSEVASTLEFESALSRVSRIHSRIVFKEICKPLKTFESSEELLWALTYALRAHRHAWEGHKILHRDVSAGNILLYSAPGSAHRIGILADWDLAKTADQLHKPSGLAWRSGTWQSMSALLQCLQDKRHELSDDLESFMHVLNWFTLKYLQNSHSNWPIGLRDQLYQCYDAVRSIAQPNGEKSIDIGPGRKLEYVRKGESIAKLAEGDRKIYKDVAGRELKVPVEHRISLLLNHLAELCKMHYDTVDIDNRMTKEVQIQPPVKQPPTGLQWTVSLRDRELEEHWSANVQETVGEVIDLNDPLPEKQVLKHPSTSPLLTHKEFIKAFYNTFNPNYFRNVERREDQCPVDTDPFRSGTRSGSKRSSDSGNSPQASKRQRPANAPDTSTPQKDIGAQASSSLKTSDSGDVFGGGGVLVVGGKGEAGPAINVAQKLLDRGEGSGSSKRRAL